MKLKIFGGERYVSMNTIFESVENASEPFTDEYDGLIGIAPYQRNIAKKEANFMW